MADDNEVGIAEIIVEAHEALSHMLVERAQAGAEKYGEFAFLGNDVVRMAMEEIADMMNYGEMQFIKLYILQRYLEQQIAPLQDSNGDLGIGFDSFKGTTEGWNK
jgi:hypothetical protein